MGDKRSERTSKNIKTALVRLLTRKRLDAITVSELAREAHVSRSTFYAHYPNVNDVFEAAVRDFHQGVRSPYMQTRCSICHKQSGKPYCVYIREAGEYAPLLKEPQYFQVALKQFESSEDGLGYIDFLRSTGITEQQARAIFMFRMSGCYAVASSVPADSDWQSYQNVLDRFVAGGISALTTR